MNKLKDSEIITQIFIKLIHIFKFR